MNSTHFYINSFFVQSTRLGSRENVREWVFFVAGDVSVCFPSLFLNYFFTEFNSNAILLRGVCVSARERDL